MLFRYLWLMVAAVGLVELAAHLYFAERAPEAADWQVLEGPVRSLRQNEELVVVAPEWGEPMARHVLGDEMMPLHQVARPDVNLFKRAIEISALGKRSPKVEGWKQLTESSHGQFVLRVLENPSPVEPSINFVDAFGPGTEVFLKTGDEEIPCRFQDDARAMAGGLPGPVAAPPERFQCSGGRAHWVGVTVIDDQEYRPRRCLHAHPGSLGPLVLRFKGARLSGEIFGYAGLSYLLMREGRGTPVELSVHVDGRPIGRHVHRDEWGWRPFSFDLGELSGSEAEVRFEVSSENPAERRFCFYADSR